MRTLLAVTVLLLGCQREPREAARAPSVAPVVVAAVVEPAPPAPTPSPTPSPSPTPAPAPPAPAPITARQLRALMRRAGSNPDVLTRLLIPSRSLVVEGEHGPIHVCAGSEQADIVEQASRSIAAGTVSCDDKPNRQCTSEGGVIDPPDSDFFRTWLFFEDSGHLRGVYFGFYDDEEVAARIRDTAPVVCP